jgi:hypothetical protein
MTDERRGAAILRMVALGLPPGQWPGGTGESPVPPKANDDTILGKILKKEVDRGPVLG